MDTYQLFSLLKNAREVGNIYHIARAAIMLRHRNVPGELTEREKVQIYYCLEQSRTGHGILGLEPGYELARWLMICRYLFPEKAIEPTPTDIEMIQRACDSYCNDRILKQVASLVQMSRVLEINISITKLPPKKRKKVLTLSAALA